jgi:hypothetical protein
MALFMQPDVDFVMHVPPGISHEQLGVKGFQPGMTFGTCMSTGCKPCHGCRTCDAAPSCCSFLYLMLAWHGKACHDAVMLMLLAGEYADFKLNKKKLQK